MEELQVSLTQYNEQLCMVNAALLEASDSEKESLLALQSELHQLVQLTQESLDALNAKETSVTVPEPPNEKTEQDDQYSLFMKEMSASGAYEEDNSQEQPGSSKGATTSKESVDEMDIEDELASLLGMKCAVYHMHKWGGQPSLHNAMVSSIFPRQDEVQFNDLQVCTYYFKDLPRIFKYLGHWVTEDLADNEDIERKCRSLAVTCNMLAPRLARCSQYSHGSIVKLSDLKEAIEPDFEGIKVGSRVLLKLNPPDGEDISLTKKASERYHLWHRAVVKSVDQEKRTCVVQLESGVKAGEKRKRDEEIHVNFEEIFPLTVDESDSDSDGSLSDTEYPESKSTRLDDSVKALLLEKSLDNNDPAIGEWERHTRGIGSKLMLRMGYVPGLGLGAASQGRVQPVEARAAPRGRSLDHCMAMSESLATQDPLKPALASRRRRTTPQLDTIPEESPRLQEPRVPEPVPELQPIETTILDQSAVVPDLNVDVEKDIALLPTQPQKRTSQEIPTTCQTKRARFKMSRQNLCQKQVQHEPEIVEKENIPGNCQELNRTQLKVRIQLLQEAGLADSQVPPPEPMQPTQEEEEKRRSRTRRRESSETMLGSLDRTKVSLGDSDQTTDSMTFIRDQWGTEGTMKKILKLIKEKIEPIYYNRLLSLRPLRRGEKRMIAAHCPIYFNTLLSRGPLLPGYKRMIAAHCFNSLLKLKQHGFIKMQKDRDLTKKFKINLGQIFNA